MYRGTLHVKTSDNLKQDLNSEVQPPNLQQLSDAVVSKQAKISEECFHVVEWRIKSGLKARAESSPVLATCT